MPFPFADHPVSEPDPLAQRERDLVARVRAGDASAFEAIYDAFAPGLLGFATAQLRSHELAEELLQETFFRIWKHRADWVLAHSLKSYLFRALRNQIADYVRTNASRHELQQGDAAGVRLQDFPGVEHADDRMRESELLLAIERAIAALPPRRREAFLLVRGQRLSYAEAAGVLGVSVKAVEMHMVRAFEMLARQLDEWRR